jgi:methyl-accepting chemotaxis protein
MIETVNDTISDARKTMNLQDFESQYRNSMDETLNELQTAILLLAQAQRKISEIGNNVQNLSQIVEEFIASQKSE